MSMKSGRSSNSNMMVDNGVNNCGTESMVAQKGRKLKQYVLEEKLDIIDYAKVIHFYHFLFFFFFLFPFLSFLLNVFL